MFSNIVPAMPHVQSRRLRAIGVTTRERSPLLPDVPTVAESGLRGFEVQTLYAVLAPAGTAPEIVKRLNAAIGEMYAAQGLEATGSTPERFRQIMQAEIEKWAKVIKDANIKPE